MPLMQWEQDYPRDFETSHLWCAMDGKTVETHEREPGEIHADIWGPEAFECYTRGYYDQSRGLITCHGKADGNLRKVLARKFKDALYIRDWGS